MFNAEDIAVANATSRARGAVGSKAVVPREVRKYLEEYGHKDDTMILDFGAGKEALHTKELLKEGWYVLAHEFGDNVVPMVHSENALDLEYEVVYASNVLNVQSSETMLRKTVEQIFDVVQEGGVFIANYPQSPRKAGLTVKQVEKVLEYYFTIERTPNSSSSAPVWMCFK